MKQLYFVLLGILNLCSLIVFSAESNETTFFFMRDDKFYKYNEQFNNDLDYELSCRPIDLEQVPSELIASLAKEGSDFSVFHDRIIIKKLKKENARIILAFPFKTTVQIQEINLNDESATMMLAEALKRRQVKTTLILQNISGDPIQLKKILRLNNESLDKINIEYHKVHDNNADNLAAALGSSSKLHRVVLNDVTANQKKLEKIIKSLKNSSSSLWTLSIMFKNSTTKSLENMGICLGELIDQSSIFKQLDFGFSKVIEFPVDQYAKHKNHLSTRTEYRPGGPDWASVQPQVSFPNNLFWYSFVYNK